jgi:hypothetical protein
MTAQKLVKIFQALHRGQHSCFVCACQWCPRCGIPVGINPDQSRLSVESSRWEYKKPGLHRERTARKMVVCWVEWDVGI